MSTPIETNTEELQGVLNRMYNLPNLGGSGKVSWDCVLEAKGTNEHNLASSLAVVSGSFRSVFDKARSGEKANVLIHVWDDYDGDFDDYFSECVFIKSFYTDYNNIERLFMDFFYNCLLVRIDVESASDIDSNTITGVSVGNNLLG